MMFTGCLWFEWDIGHHHHHDGDRGDRGERGERGERREGGERGERDHGRYFLQGVRYEAPERFSVQGSVILPVTWNASAGTTAAESQTMPEAQPAN